MRFYKEVILKKHSDYLPEFLGVILALLLLNLWYLSSFAIEYKILPVSLDYLYKGTVILIGAFVGAFSAFKLNSKNEEDKKYTEQKMAMNKALFVSIRQINAIKNMYKKLSQYNTELEKAFMLPAMKPPCYDELKYDFDELNFLLKDYPQTMMNLVIEQERFDQTFNSIQTRNNFYIHDVQPALSKHKLNRKNILVSDLANLLGERLFEGAINGAKSMYFHIESTDKSITEMHDEISKVAQKAFPNERFIKWKENN